MPRFSAVIFDLDGTAMPSSRDAVPSQHLGNVVRAHNDILKLCAATGRSWFHARPVIEALGLTDPCIINGGALILDPVSREVLWQETIGVKTSRRILDTAQGFSYEVAFTQELEISTKGSALDAVIEAPVNTFYILDIPPGEDGEVVKALAHIPGITISKALSWFADEGTDLHITNNEATKEHAVAELCAILGVDRANAAGVGDGFNDLHLFQAVGHKVAMGNAVPELKEAADIIIGSVTEDGLADFIEEVGA